MSEVFSTEWWTVTGYTALFLVGATVLALVMSIVVRGMNRTHPVAAFVVMLVATFIGSISMVSAFAWWTA